jgi:hypothetical protein
VHLESSSPFYGILLLLIHFHPHLSVPSSISLSPPPSGGWTRNCIILGIPLRSSLTAPFLCPSLTFGRRAHSTPSVSILSHENPISTSPTASYAMSQLNTKESTPTFVVTGLVPSTIRRARAQTVPLFRRVSQDKRVWNSSYQLARPHSPPPAPIVLSSSPLPTPPDTSMRCHIAGASKKTPRMWAATKQAMKKRLLGKRRFNPAIKIRVETEVTEVIEVDNLVDTTPGDSFWNPIVMDEAKSRRLCT